MDFWSRSESIACLKIAIIIGMYEDTFISMQHVQAWNSARNNFDVNKIDHVGIAKWGWR